MNKVFTAFRFVILVLFTCLNSNRALAQFVINGSATETASGEYTLTKAQNNQVGTIWSEQKISLNDPFEIELELYFGTKDGNGADGITFSLQPKSNTVGVSGGGLGIGGITPSLITEMDTYQNGSYGDPSYDHIALVKNTVDHRGADNLVTPTQIVNGQNNVEDGAWYNFKAKWNPTDQVYQVFVNGIQRFSYEGDIINTVFNGESDVYWGFTASTGGANNEQKVRIINTTIIDLFDCTETPNDQTFCDASGPALVTFDFSNVQADATYEWFDTKDRDNLLGTGLTYTDNAVTENKDYYVVATFPEVINTSGTVGPTPSGSNGIQETAFFDGNNRDFTVLSDLTINSVELVLPTYNGGCFAVGTTLANTIDILNSGGATISSTNIIGNCGETTTVTLNVDLTPGAYTMKLRTWQFNSFQVTGDGTEKSIPGVITLEDNTITNTWGTKNFSGVFFNWNVTGGSGTGTGTAECLFSVKAEKDCPPCSTFPSASIGSDFTYCSENDTTIKVTSTGANILWSTSETTNQIIISEGTYTVEVWDDPNCSSFDNIIVSRECPSEPIELLPDTIEVCASVLDTVRASNIEVGSSWSGTDAFTYINDSMVSLNLQNDAKYYVTNYVRLNILSDNIDFEDPKITTGFKIMDADLVPGWETTASDNAVEIWQSGFQGVPSYKGDQFMELNANQDAALYQKMSSVPGEVIGINLAHRGRSGPDEMRLMAGADIAGPFVEINRYLDGVNTWGFYTEYYTVPAGQTTTYFMFETVSCNGGPCTGSGNFLDAIEFYKVEQQTDSVYVKVLQSPSFELGNNQVVCEENSVLLDAGNVGFNYDWNTNETSQTIEVTQSGIYSVRVYAGSCEITDDITVTVQLNPVVDLGDDIDICQGTAVLLDAQNAGLNYEWNTSATTKTISPTLTAEYSVIVKDALGCEGSDDIKVVINSIPVVELGNDTIICGDVDLELDANNEGANHLWSTGSTTQTIDVILPGTYTVDVTLNGCTGTGELKVDQSIIPVVSLGKDTTICASNILQLDAENTGLNFLWSTNAATQTIDISISGKYSVIVKDAFGCEGADDIEVIVNPIPDVDLGNDTTICEGATLNLDAQNVGFSYLWTNMETSRAIEITTGGIYQVTVSSSPDCLDQDEIKVTVQDNPIVALGDDKAVCLGKSYVLDAQNTGLEYLWSTGEVSQEIEVITSGLYTVKVSDAFGCSETGDFDFIVNPLPEVSITLVDNVCYESELLSIQTTPLGGILYGSGVFGTQFNPKSLDLEIDKTTVVYYSYTDANNCNSLTSKNITLRAEPYAPTLEDTLLCLDESAQFIVNTGVNTIIEWYETNNDNILSTNASVSLNSEGDYYAKVSNEYCSSLTNIFNVTVLDPQVEIEVSPEESIQLGESVQLAVINPNADYSYAWTGDLTAIGDGEIIVNTPIETTDYEVTVSIAHCENSTNVIVKVIQPIIVPSMFTPNGDGLNDVWGITGLEGYSYYKLKVYNRWGTVVFDNYGDYEAWDGNADGKVVPAAVYYYVIELGESGDKLVKGSVTILR
jgi:gliding motility-associated-like protein